MVNKDSKNHTGEKYIFAQRYSYVVYKNLDGRQVYFGSFKTLEDAKKYRDYCQEHEWDLRCRRKQVGRMFAISDMEMCEGVKVV